MLPNFPIVNAADAADRGEYRQAAGAIERRFENNCRDASSASSALPISILDSRRRLT
jgi:hypothetical protein